MEEGVRPWSLCYSLAYHGRWRGLCVGPVTRIGRRGVVEEKFFSLFSSWSHHRLYWPLGDSPFPAVCRTPPDQSAACHRARHTAWAPAVPGGEWLDSPPFSSGCLGTIAGLSSSWGWGHPAAQGLRPEQTRAGFLAWPAQPACTRAQLVLPKEKERYFSAFVLSVSRKGSGTLWVPVKCVWEEQSYRAHP